MKFYPGHSFPTSKGNFTLIAMIREKAMDFYMDASNELKDF